MFLRDILSSSSEPCRCFCETSSTTSLHDVTLQNKNIVCLDISSLTTHQFVSSILLYRHKLVICKSPSVVWWLPCLKLDPVFSGSKPGQGPIKIRSTTSFGGEVKPSVPFEVLRHVKEPCLDNRMHWAGDPSAGLVFFVKRKTFFCLKSNFGCPSHNLKLY
jgi:hypothetical protein